MCVRQSFRARGRVVDYPRVKLFVNRLANLFIRVLFRHGLNDTTNAFKAYRRHVVEGCRPLLAPHFNLTVELPLKAIVRGYTWTITPISWENRKHGVAKLKIKEMGSRYFFICMYVWLENISAAATTAEVTLAGQRRTIVAFYDNSALDLHLVRPVDF